MREVHQRKKQKTDILEDNIENGVRRRREQNGRKIVARTTINSVCIMSNKDKNVYNFTVILC